MIGLARVLGFARALVSGRAGSKGFALGLCGVAACSGMPVPIGSPPPTNEPASGGSGGFPPPSLPGGSTACIPAATAMPAFAQQVFGQQMLFSREFYTWTTDEQMLSLREKQTLFSESAWPGAPFTDLTVMAASASADAQLARVLSDEFKMGRYAWPEPWATRMGWPGQDPGHQLVRIVLKPEAWLAVLINGSLVVYDAKQRLIPATEALAHSEQIGAIFFDSFTETAIPSSCNRSSGYREFVLGNLAMVQEWSLGTQQIADRVRSNIAQLTQFLNDIRSCPVTSDAATWAQTVLCSWFAQGQASSTGMGVGGDGGGGSSGAGFGGDSAAGFGSGGFGESIVDTSDAAVYGQALAIPSANYLAAPAQIATMIETLQGDLFEPDPLVVTPGSP